MTELSHGENRREVIGKNLAQVKADSDFFMRITYHGKVIGGVELKAKFPQPTVTGLCLLRGCGVKS